MYMNARSHIVAAILFFAALFLLPANALAQNSQDDQPHIQPRNSPTPTPTPTPKPAANQPPAPKKDQYDRPPFPGDAPGTNPTGGSASGESSSKDTQIDNGIHSNKDKEEPAAPAEDATVLRPWDPHKAAKDVEVAQDYLKLKNYRAALERFNHALTYKPNDAEAIFGLAVTQEKLDLPALADQNYRRYLEILPNGPKSKDAQEGLKRVEPHVATGNSTESVANPAQAAAHDMNVGETYLAGNNFDAARQRFEDALRLTPDNPLIWFRLAQSLQGMQRLDPARLYYRKYLEAQPKGKFAKDAKKAISQIDWLLGK